jgi:hypothetical protein
MDCFIPGLIPFYTPISKHLVNDYTSLMLNAGMNLENGPARVHICNLFLRAI